MDKNYLQTIQSGEERANRRKVREYLLPLFKTLGFEHLEKIRLLSIGCGFGADVDELFDSGIQAYGVEPFSRVQSWSSRKNKGHFLVANGISLPFKKESFDIILCLEVMEHVGYEEKKETDPDRVIIEREKFAREMMQVLKPIFQN